MLYAVLREACQPWSLQDFQSGQGARIPEPEMLSLQVLWFVRHGTFSHGDMPNRQQPDNNLTTNGAHMNNNFDRLLDIAARILMSHIFIISGIGKITGYPGTQAYMEKMGVPGMLLPLVIITELVGGLALLFGFKIKWAAAALAGFTLLSALIFHLNMNDQMQMIQLMKNLAMTGGLLMFVRYGSARGPVAASTAR